MSLSETGRPDIARAIGHLAATMTPPPGADPIQAMRDGVDRYGDVEPRAPLLDVDVHPADVGGVRAEWLLAEDARPDHRLVYLHGGGWVAGGLYSHRSICAHLARRSRCAVLSVDYRLAPEHPFPAGLDDSLAAIRWAARNGPDGTGMGQHLALAGDSAGGNLAAAACVRLIAAGERLPDRLALVCAALDVAPPKSVAAGDGNVDAAGVAMMMSLYAPDAESLERVELSPINATTDTLRRFPPTLIQASGAEYLLGDAQRFMARLTEARGRAVLSIWPDLPHVWHAFTSLLPEAPAALDEVAGFLGGWS